MLKLCFHVTKSQNGEQDGGERLSEGQYFQKEKKQQIDIDTMT